MSPPPVSSSRVDEAADRLARAAARREPCAPVRDLIGSDDVDAAYAVQRTLARARVARGAVVTGRKIGLTSPVVQAQLGVDQPDFGVLFEDMAVPDGGTVSTSLLLQPRIEAEIAFVLREDLTTGPIDVARVRGAVGHAVAALEIVDSRIAGWDITFGDTVADNGSSAMFVLGEDRRGLDDVEPVAAVMTMTRDGEVVSSGDGSACLGDPLVALAWLAETLLAAGDPLRAGQVVLSGALGPMVPVGPGDTFRSEISGLGPVSVTFDHGPDHSTDDGTTA